MLTQKLLSNHVVFDEKYPLNSDLESIRNSSISNFEKFGFPTKKEEEWKYTNIQNIASKEFEFFLKSNDELNYDKLRTYFFTEIDSYKLVFINGIFNSFLSETTHEEADICVLSSTFQKDKYKEVIKNYFNTSQNKSESLFSLNTAFVKEGSYIFLKKNTILSKPIQIMNFIVGNDDFPMIQPRNLIILEDNCQVQIIERTQNIGNSESFTNAVTEVFVGKNSILDYYKIQNDTLESNLVDSTSITQQRDSVAKIHTFSFGGKLTRNQLNFYQKGVNSNSILKGITLISDNQLVDHHTLVDHFVPNCESHELYRGIFDGTSKGVFNGKIIVDKEAQKTNAFQQNNNLLLSNTATIDTKPQLEIFADDVKCSHGCTVGQLDQDAMFYLQSRGIPEKEAKALLTLAFTSDVLDTVEIPAIKEKINYLIAKKLGVSLEL